MKPLLKSRKIFFDTSIYIYFFEQNQKYFPKTEKLFKFVENKKILITASSLILTELLVWPYREKNISLVQDWYDFFTTNDGISIIDLSPIIAAKAAWVRAKYRLKTPDSVHIATALENKCDIFISNDKKLKQIKEIKVLTLEDL